MSQNLYGIYPNSWPFIAESREIQRVSPDDLDALWASGWRHFGTEFFRSSLMVDEMCLKRQVALRIEVPEFQLSRSQKRTLKRNTDLDWHFAAAKPGKEEYALFERHKSRFARNVPEHLREFLGECPDKHPGPCLQLSVRHEGRLVAASYLSLGARSCSSVYAVFDPDESRRRLGILTMLLELEFANTRALTHYYSGYATLESSCYDYKKDFSGLSFYDWGQGWRIGEEMAR